MDRAVILAGFGGQGLLFAGQVLARAALAEGRETFWIPAYGPEMRGGTAACTVIVGDEPIGSPIPDRLEGLVALNPPSLAKYEPLLAPGGLLVVNSTLVEADPRRSDVDVVTVPCTRLAKEAGDERATCLAGLGALLARRAIVGSDAAEEALRGLVAGRGAGVLEIDLAALRAGVAWATREARVRGSTVADAVR
jgi:2-oxoglutarate ferredoxin oxidoreductase subunit gamma